MKETPSQGKQRIEEQRATKSRRRRGAGKKLTIDAYQILVPHGGIWRESGDPWDTQEQAVARARTISDKTWIVVDGAGHPVAYGDARGLQGDTT
jgi:hypothetical protein